ncbi:MAG TPA: ATP-binding protein [Candidatus Saccharimonadales bacterium]|jgi:hypothetical protein
MSGFINVIRKNSRPYLESLRDDIANRRNPHFFWPTGTQVYVGRQGSGKTVSAVKHVHDMKLRYPRSIIVSNVDLKYFKRRPFTDKAGLAAILTNIDPVSEYVFFEDMEQLGIALTGVNNEFYGVIYLIDEIHTYFNALESKNIPMFVFTEISQQRKQRKVIIGSSQLFMRMAKPFREQADNMIICNTIFGILTIQKAFDGMSLSQDYDGGISGHVRKTGWFFHTRKIRNSFDTYQKVVSGAEQYDTMQQPMQLVSKGRKVQVK